MVALLWHLLLSATTALPPPTTRSAPLAGDGEKGGKLESVVRTGTNRGGIGSGNDISAENWNPRNVLIPKNLLYVNVTQPSIH